MTFEKVDFVSAFYDDYYETVFYEFKTVPEIDGGQWAISRDGDSAFNLLSEQVTQTFPAELMSLLEHIPENVEIEGLEG